MMRTNPTESITRRWAPGMALALSVAASWAGASVMVAPRNLAELATSSAAVVEIVAGASHAETRGGVPVTVTDATVRTAVWGSLQAGDVIGIVAPGGGDEEQGWLVEGSPRFNPGVTYLVMLSVDRAGLWRTRALSYGALQLVEGRDGTPLLEPMPESGTIEVIASPGNADYEPIGTYREQALVDHLRAVMDGREAWDSRKVLALPAQVPLHAGAAGAAFGCPMMGQDSGDPARWKAFDSGQTVRIYSDAAGEPDLGPDGGHRQVRDAVAMWMSVPGTDLKIQYGGTKSAALRCSASFDTPSWSDNLVVFGDPCGDIDDMSNCTGIAAWGGPFYSGSHTYNGRTWRTIVGWYVIVNNGASCIGTDVYTKLIAHELGHGLGFAHSEDPQALMYQFCCNAMDDTDRACVKMVYPGNNPGAPEPPAGVAASDGVAAGRVDVSWQAVANASSYEVWEGSGPDFATATELGSTSGTTYSDLGAPAGSVRYYFVRSVNKVSTSDPSAPDTGYAACSADATSLQAPPVAPSGAAYAVDWASVPGASGYVVEEATSPDFASVKSVTAGTTSQQFQHEVSASSVFYYRVRPVVPCGASQAVGSYSTVAQTTVVAQSTGSGTVSYIPGAAAAAGANGTAWRTDLEINNPGTTDATVRIERLDAGVANADPAFRDVTVGAGASFVVQDALQTLFGRPGTAALRVTSVDEILVSARTFNDAANGTFGQYIPAFDGSSMVTPAHAGRLLQLSSSASSSTGKRTNIGLINTTSGPVDVSIKVRSSAGEELGTLAVTLGGFEVRQINNALQGMAGGNIPSAFAVVETATAGAEVVAYASVIDNQSGDPILVPTR